jgi:hypothetical protein
MNSASAMKATPWARCLISRGESLWSSQDDLEVTDDVASDSVMHVVIGACVVAFTASFVWAVSTLFLSEPVVHTHAWLIAFLGIFPLMFFVVSGGRGIRSWRPRRVSFSYAQLRARLPLIVLVLAHSLFLACWILAATALWDLRNGGPDIVNGAFYANSHGALTPISETRYHQLQLAEQRLFTAVPAAFYVFGAMYLLWLLRRPRVESSWKAATANSDEPASG